MLRRLACAAAVLLAGCRDDPPPARPVGAFGGATPIVDVRPEGKGEIATVIAARLTDGGGHVVVLDMAPPFVKVFDRRGKLTAAFVGRGGGPGEIQLPGTLATSGDSAILVADGRGSFSVFDLEGKLKAHAPPRGIFPLSAAGCGDAWIVYGPALKATGASPWLHEMRIPAQGDPVVRGFLPDTMPRRGVGAGIAYGFTSGGGGLALWHEAGGAIYAATCADPSPRRVAEVARLDAPEMRREGDRAVARTGPDTRYLAGMAPVRGGYVTAHGVGGSRTELTLHGAGETKTVAVDGEYFLRDAGPEGILVSTNDPAPRLFVVPESALLALFGGT